MSTRARWHQHNGDVHISARVDYAMRALLELASDPDAQQGQLVKAEVLARRAGVPLQFLEAILRQLRQAGIVASMRGADGGFKLAQPAGNVTVADVVRALDGPLAAVRGDRPENVSYHGAAAPLQQVWIATRAAMRRVLDHVTLADLVAGKLPPEVTEMIAEPGAWGMPQHQ